MQSLVSKARSLVLLAAVALAPSALAKTAHDPSALSIQVDGSVRLTPTDVRYQWQEQTLAISGHIDKRRDYYGRIPGHVNIDLIGDDSRVLRRHSGALGTFSPSKRNPHSAYFRTRVDDVPAGVVQLRVTPATGTWH
ncbi:MAG: hypothetical protein WBM40_21650 [Thiohalocapsa sp.]